MEISPHCDPISLLGRRWFIPELERFAVSEPSHGLPTWLGAILARRGISEAAAVSSYLDPSLRQLPDPASMADMPAAIDRILTALRQQQPMVVYGDYDVDGVCAAAIMVEFLSAVGGQVTYYIPDRRTEGYGLNRAAMANLANQARVLITVDCGITAIEEIALAQSLDLDVVVVDHHRVPATLPAAVACLNPQRQDCGYPFKELCAAGVAFMLVMGLRRALRADGAFQQRAEPDLRTLLDLVAVATVADMVAIRGTNRVLVAAGLRRLATAARPGLAALCAVAKINRPEITAADLGFRLGPRINARGRMSDANLAVRLMLTRDADEAMRLATVLNTANDERRQVEKATVEAALGHVETQALHQHAALVLYDPNWHPGVLGLVASRLVGRFHRPALVIGEGGRGSGRSIEGVDLHAALQAIGQHFIRFGGHPAAAGVTVAADKVSEVRTALAAQVHNVLGAPPYTPTLQTDGELPAHLVTLKTVAEVQRLAPFGQGNPAPLFVAKGLLVDQIRLVGGDHLKIRFGQIDAIGFGLAALQHRLPRRVDAAFHLERNVYQDRSSVQMRLVDLRATAEN